MDEFKNDCRLRGLTKHTIETYLSNVRHFLEKYDPKRLTTEDLKNFLGDLLDRGLEGSTLKGYFAAINAFFEYLIFEGQDIRNPIPSFRKRYLTRIKPYHQADTRQLLTIQEMALVISAAPGIKEKALILVLAKTGVRRGELLALQVSDLDLKNNIMKIPAKAKRSNRVAFIDAELRRILDEYVPIIKAEEKRLFPVHKDAPGRLLADLGASLGLHSYTGPMSAKLTPHCCRHFFTTWLFRAGMDPQHIKFLRGDSLRSEAWQIYNHLDLEEIRAEYERRIPKLLDRQIDVQGDERIEIRKVYQI